MPVAPKDPRWKTAGNAEAPSLPNLPDMKEVKKASTECSLAADTLHDVAKKFETGERVNKPLYQQVASIASAMTYLSAAFDALGMGDIGDQLHALAKKVDSEKIPELKKTHKEISGT